VLSIGQKIDYPIVNIVTNRGIKRDFDIFASKIQFLSKEVYHKVSSCKTSSGKVVATSFPYLTVYR